MQGTGNITNVSLYVSVCIYVVLRYFGLIAILTTIRDQTHAPCAGPQIINRSQILAILNSKQTNPLIARSLELLPVHGNQLRLFGANAFPYLTINIVYLAKKQQVGHLTSLAMTQYGPSIEDRGLVRSSNFKAELRASGTKLTTAEHLTQNRPVLSG